MAKKQDQDCTHEDTRKMFYMYNNKWVRTPFSFCLACGYVVVPGKPEKVEVKEK